MRYLVGNWKSHYTITQATAWLTLLDKASPHFNPELKVILSLPFTDLPEANRFINQHPSGLQLAAQDVSAFPEGQHTGEVTAQMLSELVSYCIIGHSERRRMGETSDQVALKARALQQRSITPIICLDIPYLEEQVRELFNLQLSLSTCLLAYEPQDSIGTDNPQDPAIVNNVASQISFLTGTDTPILYGGSVTAQNCLDYVRQPSVAGLLVGGQSLSVNSFVNLINLLS
ncbi:triosephosphate isomerase [Candidatus Collierbacteria bacterium]|nr:triosephosphate isomerase [Candidatus Collierbacteria bacterium]